MTNRAVLRTFNSRPEAELVRSILAGSEIESFIVSDDCGTIDPALGFGRGVALLVDSEDLDRASRVMTDTAHPDGGGDR